MKPQSPLDFPSGELESVGEPPCQWSLCVFSHAEGTHHDGDEEVWYRDPPQPHLAAILFLPLVAR